MNWMALVNIALSALGIGIAAAATAHATGADWTASASAGFAAAVGAVTNHVRTSPLGGA